MYVLDTMAKPAYAKLSDAQKADALKKAVAQAKEATNITLAGDVARSPHESALMQWAQTPQYYGISTKDGPEAVARKNWEISQAKAKRAAYRKEYGEMGDQHMGRDDPAAYRLAQREAIDKQTLDTMKYRIDKATGGALTEAEKSAGRGRPGRRGLDDPASYTAEAIEDGQQPEGCRHEEPSAGQDKEADRGHPVVHVRHPPD